MEGVKERANQTGAKTNLHVSELETALKDVEGRERARCRRWRASARVSLTSRPAVFPLPFCDLSEVGKGIQGAFLIRHCVCA